MPVIWTRAIGVSKLSSANPVPISNIVIECYRIIFQRVVGFLRFSKHRKKPWLQVCSSVALEHGDMTNPQVALWHGQELEGSIPPLITRHVNAQGFSFWDGLAILGLCNEHLHSHIFYIFLQTKTLLACSLSLQNKAPLCLLVYNPH